MKISGVLLIVVSLVAGLIASTTAYLPRVDAIDAEDRLTLNAPAGQAPDDPRSPLLVPDDPEPVVLTADRLALLHEAGVQRVKVKEFAWPRWTHRWWFVAAAAGLILGAVMVRQASRRQLAEMIATQQESRESPEDLLRQASDAVDRLRTEVAEMTDRPRQLQTIIDRLDEVHDQQLDPFVAAKPVLIGRLGMTGYAQLMDHFAAGERQVNRAWSAAADGVLEEAQIALEEASGQLRSALRRLRQLNGDEQHDPDEGERRSSVVR